MQHVPLFHGPHAPITLFALAPKYSNANRTLTLIQVDFRVSRFHWYVYLTLTPLQEKKNMSKANAVNAHVDMLGVTRARVRIKG